ncbi:RNA-guided endonuclease InsQ/TnpB family protein [Ectobacillus polymachus]|uniref:RNA-guided endonuclease InsQ/TnpB family protein n=1 Tax=Ectobacillus polymachus TaxID=1508806 RepID=UPI003A8434DF
MYRGKKVFFTASKSIIQKLFACNRISADIWNACLQEAKQHYMVTGKWINKTQLQQATKGKFPLHSQSVQAVCHKYVDNRDSTHKAIQKGIKTSRYPYRKKKYFNAKWVDQAFKIHEKGRIELSLGIQNGKRVKPLVIYAKNLPVGDIKEIELCFDHNLYLSVTYDNGSTVVPSTGTQSAGVDMGEIHSFACVTENGQSVILSGRKLRSIHRFRNQKLKELQRLMSHCKKGSRQWKKYNRAKQYILSKSEAQLRDATHKNTKHLIDWCVEQSVHTLYVGDVRNVSKKTKQKKKANKGNRQKLSNWNVGQQVKYVKYKAEAKGIQVVLRNEAFTTQTCPVCKRLQKPKGRHYQCICGYNEHRDVHSAGNILTDALFGMFMPITCDKNPMYLRVA